VFVYDCVNIAMVEFDNSVELECLLQEKFIIILGPCMFIKMEKSVRMTYAFLTSA